MGVDTERAHKKPPIVSYVETRLLEWAEWLSVGRGYGLGYAPCSLEYRFMTEGIVKSATPSGFRPIPEHAAAEEMERLVVELAEQNPNLAKALRGYYLMGGSLRRKAQRLQMSHTQLKYAVDMAHQWLAGRLSGKKMI